MQEDDELFWVGIDKTLDGNYVLIETASTETSEVHSIDLNAEGGEAKAKVSGWGVYCYDFLLLPVAPGVFCSRVDAPTTPSSTLPPSPAVSCCLPLSPAFYTPPEFTESPTTIPRSWRHASSALCTRWTTDWATGT